MLGLFQPEHRGKVMGKAPDKQTQEVADKTVANVDSFFKRYSGRIKLIDELTLDCEMCRSKEAKELLQKQIDLNLKGLKTDVDKLNKQNQSLFKVVPKPQSEDVLEKIKKEIEKKKTIYQKDNKTLKLDFDFEIKGPKLIFEW